MAKKGRFLWKNPGFLVEGIEVSVRKRSMYIFCLYIILKSIPKYLQVSPGKAPLKNLHDSLLLAFPELCVLWSVPKKIGPPKNYSSRWWFQIFFILTPNPGEMIQFDEHIFQLGWNHQPVHGDLHNFGWSFTSPTCPRSRGGNLEKAILMLTWRTPRVVEVEEWGTLDAAAKRSKSEVAKGLFVAFNVLSVCNMESFFR